MHITTLKTSHTINLKEGFYSHFKQTMCTKLPPLKALAFYSVTHADVSSFQYTLL